jgi:hypothetical protein
MVKKTARDSLQLASGYSVQDALEDADTEKYAEIWGGDYILRLYAS